MQNPVRCNRWWHKFCFARQCSKKQVSTKTFSHRWHLLESIGVVLRRANSFKQGEKRQSLREAPKGKMLQGRQQQPHGLGEWGFVRMGGGCPAPAGCILPLQASYAGWRSKQVNLGANPTRPATSGASTRPRRRSTCLRFQWVLEWGTQAKRVNCESAG